MEAEQQEEWYALEQQAVELLRRGNKSDRPRVSLLFQMLVLPSFAAAFSWEICREVKVTNRYFAVHRVWNRDADLSKLETPVVRLRYPRPLAPTIEIRQYPLLSDWVEATQATLQSLVIPVMVKPAGIGLDGTSYELAFDAGSVQARYGWWEEPPEGWRPLNGWLQQTLETLEQQNRKKYAT